MTDLSQDVKIKRLLRGYGVEGYGLYLYILELIVRRLDKESPMPDLEESSKDIAADTGMDVVKVEQIMWFCIEQGLFDQDEMTGRLVAHKVYKFLQASETRSTEIRAMIKAYSEAKKPPLLASQTVTDNCEEQNRTEQNRTDKQEGLLDRVNRIHSELFNVTVPVTDQVKAVELARTFTDDTLRAELVKASGRERRVSAIAYVYSYMTKQGYQPPNPQMVETETTVQRLKREAAE